MEGDLGVFVAQKGVQKLSGRRQKGWVEFKSSNLSGWKRSLRSSSLTFNLVLTSPLLNHAVSTTSTRPLNTSGDGDSADSKEFIGKIIRLELSLKVIILGFESSAEN